jgi:hypothetical protein
MSAEAGVVSGPPELIERLEAAAAQFEAVSPVTRSI